MDDQTLLSILADEISWASDAREERRAAWDTAVDYFYGRLPNPPPQDDLDQGASSVVSTDVGDAVEAVLSEIMPAFSGHSPVEFVPSSQEDEARAALETMAVTSAAEKAGAYMALSAAVKDALLRRAGAIKVYWDERTKVSYESFDGIPQAALPQIMAQSPGSEIVDGEIDDFGMFYGTVRRSTRSGQARIDPVPIDELLISANAASPLLDEVRFVAHQRLVTRSELVELGIDREIVDSLQTYNRYASTLSRARASSDLELRSAHTSTEYVMATESYYRIDMDGDGIAELRLIVTAGGHDGAEQLLLNVPVDDNPIAIGVGYLGIYSWDGVSLNDKLQSIQTAKTGLLRAMLDATKRNLKQRIGVVRNDADPDDVKSSQLGGMVRCATPNGVFALPEIKVGEASFAALEYLDAVRRDKGGGAIDTAAQAQAIAGDTAHGLERMMSAAEQVNAMVAKNLAETLVKPMYRKLHALLRRHSAGTLMIRSPVGWQQADPRQWGSRDDLTLSMGMSVGERTRRTAALNTIMARQDQDMQSGMAGILVDPVRQYQARVDMARMAGLPMPEQYYINPQSPQAQQAQQQKQQQAIAAQRAQEMAQQQMLAAQYKMATDVERIRAEAQNWRTATQAKIDEMRARLDATTKILGERVEMAKIKADIDIADVNADVKEVIK